MQIENYIRQCYYDKWGSMFFAEQKDGNQLLCQFSDELFETDLKFIDSLGKWIELVINSKIKNKTVNKNSEFIEYLQNSLVYDSKTQWIYLNDKEFILIRGWGNISNLFSTLKEAESFQDEIGKWIVNVINEQL